MDTGSSPAQGRAIRESLSSVTDRPLAAVVVTHWHHDHSFGLAAFAGIPTIGHESVRARLGSSEAAAEAVRLGVATAELAAPEREIVVATAVDLGGRRVEIAHLGRGHTDGDLVVVVPDADLLFAGDLIESAGPPSFGPDSVPAEWAGTLDGLIGLMTRSHAGGPGPRRAGKAGVRLRATWPDRRPGCGAGSTARTEPGWRSHAAARLRPSPST